MNVRHHGKAIFVPLPGGERRPINGGCNCAFCKAHPDQVPQWDALGINTANPTDTWTVHYPELRCTSA